MSTDIHGRAHKAGGSRAGGRYEAEAKAEPAGVDLRPRVSDGDRDAAPANKMLRTVDSARKTAVSFTNPFAPNTKNWFLWEETGTKALSAQQARLVTGADAAYDRQDRAWFNSLSTPDLVTLWNLVSGINSFSSAGAWDDEVSDALYFRDYDFGHAAN